MLTSSYRSISGLVDSIFANQAGALFMRRPDKYSVDKYILRLGFLLIGRLVIYDHRRMEDLFGERGPSRCATHLVTS